MPDAKNKTTALIVGRGLLTAEAVASELRARLLTHLGQSYRFMPHILLMEEARRILAEFEPILADNLHGTDLAAWIAGFDDVAKKLPPYILDAFGRLMGGPPKPPGKLILPSFFGDDEPIIRFPLIEKAAQSLADRNILRKSDFERVSDAEKAKAFTVAGELSEDTLATIRDVLSETVQEGASLEVFKANLGERLQGSFAGPAHLETVMRTNTQAAFYDGQEELASDPIVADVFPYKTWDAIHDARVRSTHLALEKLGLSGTNVFRADDPFWIVWRQPAGFNCRCGSTYITIESAARRGVSEAAVWLRTGVKPPLQSRLPFIPFKPDRGFGVSSVAA